MGPEVIVTTCEQNSDYLPYYAKRASFPLLVEPAQGATWTSLINHRSKIQTALRERGAILLRGWNTSTPAAFTGSLEAVLGPGAFLHRNSTLRGVPGGTLSRTKIDGHPHIFSASEAPPTWFIPHHCEQSYCNNRCRYIAFWCRERASFGGQTPIFDMRKTYESLSPRLQNVLLDSYFKVGPGWGPYRSPEVFKVVFGTQVKEEIDMLLESNGMVPTWSVMNGESTLTVAGETPMAVKHPDSGEMCLTDHIDIHSFALWACHLNYFNLNKVPTSILFFFCNLLLWLLQRFRPSSVGQMCMPHTSNGPLSLRDRLDINAAVYKNASFFRWLSNDILIIDNVRMAHARMPFKGPRSMCTSMIGTYDARSGGATAIGTES